MKQIHKMNVNFLCCHKDTNLSGADPPPALADQHTLQVSWESQHWVSDSCSLSQSDLQLRAGSAGRAADCDSKPGVSESSVQLKSELQV